MAPEGADGEDDLPPTVRMPTARPIEGEERSGVFETMPPHPAVLVDGVLWAPEIAPGRPYREA